MSISPAFRSTTALYWLSNTPNSWIQLHRAYLRQQLFYMDGLHLHGEDIGLHSCCRYPEWIPHLSFITCPV